MARERAEEEETFARRLAERERLAKRLLRARVLDGRLESARRLTEQRLRLLDGGGPEVLAYLRQREQEQKLVLLSFSARDEPVDLSALLPGKRCEVVFCSSPQRRAGEPLPEDADVATGGTPGDRPLRLSPFEVLIAEVLA